MSSRSTQKAGLRACDTVGASDASAKAGGSWPEECAGDARRASELSPQEMLRSDLRMISDFLLVACRRRLSLVAALSISMLEVGQGAVCPLRSNSGGRDGEMKRWIEDRKTQGVWQLAASASAQSQSSLACRLRSSPRFGAPVLLDRSPSTDRPIAAGSSQTNIMPRYAAALPIGLVSNSCNAQVSLGCH